MKDIDETINFDSFEMSQDECVKILTALASEIPQVLSEIAPDGWSKSHYRESIRRYREHSHIFNMWQETKIFQYLHHRRTKPEEPFDYSIYEFDFMKGKALFPDALHYKATILLILGHVLIDISRDLRIKMIHDGDKYSFDIAYVLNHLPQVLREQNLLPKEMAEKIYMLDIFHVYLKLDRSPFYYAAFRAIDKLGYSWEYHNDTFDSIMWLQKQYNQLKLTPESKGEYNITAKEAIRDLQQALCELKLAHLDPLNAEEICHAMNEDHTKEYVNAYSEVFGRLPDRYPMKVDYYVET